MRDAYIYDGLRTPFGRHGGALAAVRPDDLAADLVRTLIERSPFQPSAFEDVILGCTNQAGEDCRNVARHVGLLAGLPVEVPGVTVNRLCGSGLAALLDAARCIACAQGELFVAGGVESMSRAPIAMAKAEVPYSREVRVYDTTLGARFANPRFESAYGTDTLPQTADNIGREQRIGREESDRFALDSQRKYAAARAGGFYEGELCAVTVPGRRAKDPSRTVNEDEHPRAETSLEALGKLRPLYPGGVVTAGNASGINDGAAALLVGSREVGEAGGAEPQARIVAGAVAGVPPRLMGKGPVPASRKALERARLGLQDMDVIEINEAFATQVLGCLADLGLAYNDARVNPNGGAIAVGHPLGASGARLALTAVRQLQRSGGRYALVTMCIGVGQGIAAVLERV
jgi:acetyl-CoA C-acetyltransferase